MKTQPAAMRVPGIARRVIGDALILLALILAILVCVTMLRRIRAVVLKGDYRQVFHYQLILCGILLLFALDVRFGFFTRPRPLALKIPGWILRVAVAAFAAVIIAFSGRVIAGGMGRTAGEAGHVIVLGLALENGLPTGDLSRRLDTARQYLADHPDVVLILTGGNPDETGRTEAAVMRELLLARGVPDERMLLEDQASDTRENFRNTAQLLDPAAPVVLISSSYHMNRAVRLAEQAGFTRCLRLPAPSEPLTYGPNVLSEVILELNDLTKKQ